LRQGGYREMHVTEENVNRQQLGRQNKCSGQPGVSEIGHALGLDVLDVAVEIEHVGNFEVNGNPGQCKGAVVQVEAQPAHRAATGDAFDQVEIAIETYPARSMVGTEADFLQRQLEAEIIDGRLAGKIDPAAFQRDIAAAVDTQTVEIERRPVEPRDAQQQ